MKYLLDADWSIDYLAGIRAARTLFPTLAGDGAALSQVTLAARTRRNRPGSCAPSCAPSPSSRSTGVSSCEPRA